MPSSPLNTDPARFGELGYCLVPDVLTAAEARDLRDLLEEALATPCRRRGTAPWTGTATSGSPT